MPAYATPPSPAPRFDVQSLPPVACVLSIQDVNRARWPIVSGQLLCHPVYNHDGSVKGILATPVRRPGQNVLVVAFPLIRKGLTLVLPLPLHLLKDQAARVLLANHRWVLAGPTPHLFGLARGDHDSCCKLPTLRPG